MTSPRPMLKTKLCDLLGIDYPIIQSGMGGVAGPDLAAEVSNAGGLGILAATRLTADQVRQAIREIRAKTDRPFGVNLLIPPDLRPPVPAAQISDQTRQRRVVLPLAIQSWSLTSLQQRLFKTGGRLIRHARYFILQLAEGHLTQRLFEQILARIERLAAHPT